MSAYSFQRDAGEWSQESWRALDRAVYRWVRSHGGSALLAATAAWTSLADGGGDAALPLAVENRLGMSRLSAAEIERLRAEPMVAADDATGTRAFVLDRAERFYLWRNYVHERDAAALIRARRAAPPTPAAIDQVPSVADIEGPRLRSAGPSPSTAPKLHVRMVASRCLPVDNICVPSALNFLVMR